MSKILTPVKNFVVDHKVAIAITITAAAGLALVARNQTITNKFLEEHDLLEEFYAIKN